MSTSEQARADAMADAETLQQSIAFEATGCLAHELIEEAGDEIWREDSDWEVASKARKKARAAFRAVPGLRGTDSDEKALHGALCLKSEWLIAPCGCAATTEAR